MAGIRKFEKIMAEETRARVGCKKILEDIIRRLGHVARKTDKDVVIRTLKMVVR